MRNPNARVSDPNEFVTEAGNPFRIVYESKVLPDGQLDIVAAGKEDIQAKIESFRSSTDMSYILKQIALGNNDVLVKSVGQYGDFTHMPKTMAEAMQLQIDAENEFYKLPLDVRGKFDNDYRRWLVGAGSVDWIEKMGLAPIKEDEKGEDLAPAEK